MIGVNRNMAFGGRREVSGKKMSRPAEEQGGGLIVIMAAGALFMVYWGRNVAGCGTDLDS